MQSNKLNSSNQRSKNTVTGYQESKCIWAGRQKYNN